MPQKKRDMRKVNVKLYEVTKEAIDQIIAEERISTGTRLTNDGAIWLLVRKARPHIEQKVKKLRGEFPTGLETDQRYKDKKS